MNARGLCVALVLVLSGSARGGELGKPFDLAVGAHADAGGLGIDFKAVPGDSRCPEGATCVWAGEGEVRLGLSANANVKEATLSTLDGKGAADFEGYHVELKALMPYPKANVKPGPYVVTLLVTKGGAKSASPAPAVSPSPAP